MMLCCLDNKSRKKMIACVAKFALIISRVKSKKKKRRRKNISCKKIKIKRPYEFKKTKEENICQVLYPQLICYDNVMSVLLT